MLGEFSGNMNDLPPHVFLSNLSVCETQRRQGVGSMLLSSVYSYAMSLDNVDLVALDVDNDNTGAINMYKKHGYKYVYKNDEFGIMVKCV